jgi:putative nucleotidyltransferase with HDIG domain
LTIDYDAASALLERYRPPEAVVAHCRGVARVAFDLARAIAEAHPRLGVDPDKVRVAALLHDIGRVREGAHEQNTVAILREEGLSELADIAMHGASYEASVLTGRPDESLLPQSIEQKILCYADLRYCQRPMGLRERLDDAMERRSACPEAVRTIRLAEERLFRLEAELLELAEGFEPSEIEQTA